MPWLAVVFTPEQVARLEHANLEDEFDLLFRNLGSPKGMALFVLKSFTSYPMYYLSPIAAECFSKLRRVVDGVPCSPPKPHEVNLIEGDVETALTLEAEFRSSDQHPNSDTPPPQDHVRWTTPKIIHR